ncbi:MAG: NAD(P)H-quinone oxidoreductase [Candidatus Dormibacteria bacterium]
MRAIVVEHPGGPEVLRVSDVPDPQAGPDDVLISVAFAGVNRADLLQRMGFYPPPPGASDILGLEVSGTVVAAPRSSGLAAGDRVMALIEGGGYAELAATRATQVMKVPASLDLMRAGGVPEVFITAHDNLFTRAQLQHGETVLIHGGSGGVGAAAIQLAHHAGCRVAVTASAPKLGRCMELGADVTVDYARDDFVERVKKETDGRGADVILDVMGAAYLERNIAALAPDGRLVIIATQGGATAELNIAPMLRTRASIIVTTLRARPPEQKAAIVARMVEAVLPLLADGALRPIIDRVLPLADAGDAHRALNAGEIFGKVLLQVAEVQ